MRATALEEIRATARRVLVENGHTGLTTRAVAREMGMSSPALYRYFASHDELEDAVLVGLFDELCEFLRTAAERPTDSAMDRLVHTSRALRWWSLAHVREFEFMLVFPMSRRGVSEEQLRARREFGGVLLGLVSEAARPHKGKRRTESPTAGMTDAAIESMVEYCRNCGVELEDSVAAAAMQCWMRLYGAVAMATMGQLDALGDHAASLFEHELISLAELLGYPDYTPPPAD